MKTARWAVVICSPGVGRSPERKGNVYFRGSLGATWGLRRGHVNPCEALSIGVIRKWAADGHLWQQARRNCCPVLHAVLASDVYNREVIPRWKERFGGASAADA